MRCLRNLVSQHGHRVDCGPLIRSSSPYFHDSIFTLKRIRFASRGSVQVIHCQHHSSSIILRHCSASHPTIHTRYLVIHKYGVLLLYGA